MEHLIEQSGRRGIAALTIVGLLLLLFWADHYTTPVNLPDSPAPSPQHQVDDELEWQHLLTQAPYRQGSENSQLAFRLTEFDY